MRIVGADFTALVLTLDHRNTKFKNILTTKCKNTKKIEIMMPAKKKEDSKGIVISQRVILPNWKP